MKKTALALNKENGFNFSSFERKNKPSLRSGLHFAEAKSSPTEGGFTLIEMLVVTAILGLLLGIAAQVFITILRNQNKTNLTTEIRQNAALVIDTFERDARSAIQAETMCPGGISASPPCSLDTSNASLSFLLSSAGYTGAGLTSYGVRFTYRSGDQVYWLCLTEDASVSPRQNGRFMRGSNPSATSLAVALTNTSSTDGVSITTPCIISVEDTSQVHLLKLDFQAREGADAHVNQGNKTDLSQTDVRFTTTVGLRSY
ncbi:MAG: prepilin-type N-terminal cleavage/methylation domain-containing protein [bacterium]|nr:prepilin-type N-terminal cleavage/methylation domain-containing protein [bacterium]